MKDANYLFVINPAAGQGRAAGSFESLKAEIAGRGIPFEYIYTDAPGRAEHIAREACGQGFTHIVAVGGDGTSHEVVNGIVGSSLIFGTIPLGSGNDFPKAAGIPLDTRRAVETLFSGSLKNVDLGKFRDTYFINGLGIGLDGAVSHRFKELKRMRGKLGYMLGAVQEALLFKGFKVKIRIDDWGFEGNLLLTGASNGVYHGGQFKLAPEAKVDDGLLDFYIIKDMFPLKRLVTIPKVMKGNHSGLEEVQVRQGRSMEIIIQRTVPAHIDGEPLYLEPGTHRVEVVPGALRIISCSEV